MVVTVVTWELTIPGCSSLKEKRMVIRSLKDRMRKKFNVSVAETGHQDVLTRAELSAALVTSHRRFADSVIDKVDRLVDNDRRALIIHMSRTDH